MLNSNAVETIAIIQMEIRHMINAGKEIPIWIPLKVRQVLSIHNRHDHQT